MADLSFLEEHTLKKELFALRSQNEDLAIQEHTLRESLQRVAEKRSGNAAREEEILTLLNE